jgi:hypothetical protein
MYLEREAKESGKSFRRHYPVQVHGSLALARQTLSVAPKAIWLPERSQARAIRQQRQARAPKEISATGLPEKISSAKLLF